MRTIVRTAILSAMLVLGAYAYGQDQIEEISTSPRKVTFGIRGGLSMSNLTSNYDGDAYTEKVKIGYNIGAIMDCHLTKDFYLRTGLTLTSKGAKVEKIVDLDGTEYSSKMNAVYLQVPVYFTFKTFIGSSSNMKISVAGGPFFAYGVAGKSTIEQKNSNRAGSVDTFDKDWIWNRPDIGLGIEVGLEIEKLVFTLGSDAGLARVWKKGVFNGDPYTRNDASYLTVGYNF